MIVFSIGKGPRKLLPKPVFEAPFYLPAEFNPERVAFWRMFIWNGDRSEEKPIPMPIPIPIPIRISNGFGIKNIFGIKNG